MSRRITNTAVRSVEGLAGAVWSVNPIRNVAFFAVLIVTSAAITAVLLPYALAMALVNVLSGGNEAALDRTAAPFLAFVAWRDRMLSRLLFGGGCK